MPGPALLVRQRLVRSFARVAGQEERCMATVQRSSVVASSTNTRLPLGNGSDFSGIKRQPCMASRGSSPKTITSSTSLAAFAQAIQTGLLEDLPPSVDTMDTIAMARVGESNADGDHAGFDMEELQDLAAMRCTPLSLKDMYKYAVDFGNSEQRLLNAQFLHKELPIRFAQRAVGLLTLPNGLKDVLAIRQIAQVYLTCVKEMRDFPMPVTDADEDAFTDLLQSMVLDRTSIPNAVARGVDEWMEMLEQKRKEGEKSEEDCLAAIDEMEDALYRFFTARIGLRLLTEHHILSSPRRCENSMALRRLQSSLVQENDVDEDFLGCIQTDCRPVEEVRKVASTIQKQTESHFGICPEIHIMDSTQSKDPKFTYIPHHLHYMVGELIKNSCRTVVKNWLDSDQNETIPPIRVVIVKGKEDITIKVEDEGGGIPRSEIKNVWKFAHSTASEDESSSDFGVDASTGTKIRGFGLPIARIYARYLGGELTLKSMEGYGLDAYLHLPRLGDSCENMPLTVKFSPGALYSNAPRQVRN